MSQTIDEMFESSDKLQYEEKTLLFSMLQDLKLVKRNRKLITQKMFSDNLNGLLYGSMLTVLDRGAKTFKPRDLAARILEESPNQGSLDVLSSHVENLMSSDKEPTFYKSAYRFYENYRNRITNRMYKEEIKRAKDQGDKFSASADRMEEILLIKKKPNPFVGSGKTAKELLFTTSDMLNRIWDGSYVFPKIKTGYSDFDNLLDGGFDTGSLVIMGGPTGHGKSAAAVNMACSMVKHGVKCQYTSLEESYRDVSLRMICSQSAVPRRHLLNQHLITPSEKDKARNTIEELSMRDETALQIACGGKTADEIISLIRTHHEKDGTEVFFVDYVQRIKLERENTTAEVARFALALGETARELGLVIIATSQLKREGRKELAKRKPTTYDLSESSYLENEAAYIITLFRQDLVPEIQDKDDYDPSLDGTIELIVCKQRNGMQGSIHLGFDGPCVRMTSREDMFENKSVSFTDDGDEAF